MFKINDNYLKLPGSYLFSTIAKKVAAYTEANPDAKIIRLGIGDVTQPIAPAIIEKLHGAVDEMGHAETFHGYAPDLGYAFLRDTIAKNDYQDRGCDISSDEIFVSDGAKCDCSNIQEIFSLDNKIAVCDPVYPVYVDSNVMAGRAGDYDAATERFTNVIYMPCTAENNFTPELPKETPDLIYLCFPNNPTGAMVSKAELKKWVDYALKNDTLIMYDAAYEAYIQDPEIPHSIYEIKGAKKVAIEFHSFSKTAGFTGVRCGYTVIPKELTAVKLDGERVQLNPMWNRRQCTKFNGTSYISQRAAEAIYTPEGKEQIKATINYYMTNAKIMRRTLTEMGLKVYGGTNAPYLWVKTPDGAGSWRFFEQMLYDAHVVCTPGVGFGPSGEGFVRLTAFGDRADCEEAMQRITNWLK